MGFEDVRHARPLASAGGNPAEGAAVVRRGSRAHAAMALLAAAVLSLAISGCGGSPAPAGSGTSTPPASDAASASALPDFSVQPPNIGEFILMDAKQQREYLANANFVEGGLEGSTTVYASSRDFLELYKEEGYTVHCPEGEWMMTARVLPKGADYSVDLSDADESQKATSASIIINPGEDHTCEHISRFVKELTGCEHIVSYTSTGGRASGFFLSKGKFAGQIDDWEGYLVIDLAAPDDKNFNYNVEYFNTYSAEFANGLHDDYYDYYLE